MLQVEQRAGRYYLVYQTPTVMEQIETSIQMDGDKILCCPQVDRKGLSNQLERVVEDHGWIKAYRNIELLDVDVVRQGLAETILVGIMEMPSGDDQVREFWLDPRTLTMLKKLCDDVKIIYYRMPTPHLHYDKVSELVRPIQCYYMIHNEYSESKANRLAYATRNDPGTYVNFETWQPLEKILERLSETEFHEDEDSETEIDEELLDLLEEQQPFPLQGGKLLEFVPPKKTHADQSCQNTTKVTFNTDTLDKELRDDTGNQDT